MEQVDFLQFTRTLATFRRTEAKHSSELNTVDKKIECQLKCCVKLCMCAYAAQVCMNVNQLHVLFFSCFSSVRH